LGQDPVGYPVFSSLGFDLIAVSYPILGSVVVDILASPAGGAVSYVGTGIGALDLGGDGACVVATGVGYRSPVIRRDPLEKSIWGSRLWDRIC
jgi:hypothetical protein